MKTIKITKTTFENGFVRYYAETWYPHIKIKKEEEIEFISKKDVLKLINECLSNKLGMIFKKELKKKINSF